VSLRLLYLIFVRLVGWLVLLVLTTGTELTDRMLIFGERRLRHLLDTVLVSGRRPVCSFVA
jgi:hypothetical protein